MSDYETAQRKHNIAVGVFVVVAVSALVWLIFKFGDLPITVGKINSFQVFVQFPMAPGVQQDTPVRFCGYQIGRVTDVMAPAILEDLNTGQEYHQTKVILSIYKKYINIPSNVNVKLMTRGLGSSYIELAVDPAALPAPPRDPNRPETSFLVDKMILQGSTGVTSEFFPEESQKKLDELASGISAFIKNANEIIGDKENKENIKASLANLSKASDEVTQMLAEFKKFSAAGAGATEELSKTLAELRMILGKINEGRGSVGRLVNDGRLYENLLENTEQMQVVLQELKTFLAESRDKGLPIKLK